MSTVGAFGIGPSVLLFLVNAARSLRHGAVAPADPWDGRTLEWRTSSPPPVENFAAVPPVYGRDTFWREKHGDRHGRRPTPVPTPPPGSSHLPSPSHFPILVALGLVVAAAGALVGVWIVVAGLGVAGLALFRFALEHHAHAAPAHPDRGT